MNMSGRDRCADQSIPSIHVDSAEGRPPKLLLTLCEDWSLSMERPESLQTETTMLKRDKSLGSGILDFYPSSSMTAVKIGEFEDDTVAYHSELQLEQSYGLDPLAIFTTVTEDETKKRAPEQNITLFALRLALVEKLASGIGTLSFIWASTILLGGFASNLNPVDFIVITLILVTEGTRIFTRSRELEWQHLGSKSTDNSLTRRSEKCLKDSERFGTGSGEFTKSGRRASTKAERGEPILSSEPPGLLHLERSLKASYKLTTSAASYEDLESGQSSNADSNLQRTLHLLPGGNTAGERKSSTRNELVEIVDIIDFRREKTVLGTAAAKNIKRTWSGRLVPILPGRCISTRGVSAILYWIQITSAAICLALSIWRLLEQQYNPPVVPRQDTPVNLYTSLNIFYTLALTEALLFLLERVYWEYEMNYQKLLLQVSEKADLGGENQEMMKQFFYEVYKKCIDGSVFDGLSMDIVEYSLTLLQSDNSFEQLSGLKVLWKIVDRYDGFSLDALRRTGAAPGVIERLVEMLSWRGTRQDEIRLEVAAFICRLVRYNKNCFRVAAVPGAMEGILSLLRPHEQDHMIPGLETEAGPLSSQRATIAVRLDGLRILVALARDPVNLLKIGETRGLVPILVVFIGVKDVHAFRKMEGSELKTFKKVLRLLKMLSAARNTSGTILRPMIVRVVFGIASMRDILEFGDDHPQLQWMAIEILNNLTLDESIRRSIGSTGGVIRNLFSLYSRNLDGSKTLLLSEKDKRAEMAVSERAGDALNLLATTCRKNCLRMMDLQDENGKKAFIPTLLRMLNEYREHAICAAKILRSLLEYGDCSQKREIAVCIVRVVKLIMGSSSQRLQEALLGLASRLFTILDDRTYTQAFLNVDRTELVRKLLRNLEYNPPGSYRLPRIRRHSIEFILALVNRDPSFFAEFMRDGLLEKKLVQMLDTVCEAEDFVIFSGAEGLTRHAISMEDLVQQSIHEVRSSIQNHGTWC